MNADIAFQVTNALHDIMHALDRGDGETFADYFEETIGQIVVERVGRTFVGRDSIAQMCASLHDRFRFHTHWEGNVVLKAIQKDMVQNVSYWKCK